MAVAGWAAGCGPRPGWPGATPRGTVGLTGCECDEARVPDRARQGSPDAGNAGDVGPGLEGLGPGGSVMGGGEVVATEVEEVVGSVVGGEEAPRVPG